MVLALTAFGLAPPEVAQSLAVPVHDRATWPDRPGAPDEEKR